MKHNLILDTDAYKVTHHVIYPQGTEHVVSYLEARGGIFPETMFFGLQYAMKRYLEGPVIEPWMLDEAEHFFKGVFGFDYFNRKGWQHILDAHGGRLPIRIKAVPEGLVVPVHNVLFTIENTDPEVPWLTNYLETLLFESMWYGTTVATLSFKIKQLVGKFAAEAGETVSPFYLNDFGYRGVSSQESAGLGGAAHLVNSLGTDTLAGIKLAMDYYNAKEVCGYSVMASEHSVVTMFGRSNELGAYDNLLTVAPSAAIISSVSDTYDFRNTVEYQYGVQLRDKILARDGKFVIRPDSGNPPDMAALALNMAWQHFGGTINERGFKVLNPKVGVIYGDGIDYEMIGKILERVVHVERFAPSNIIFGMGGALLQRLDRDTFKMAIKASLGKVNGEWRPVWKETATDPSKKSKAGRLALVRTPSGSFDTKQLCDPTVDKIDGDILDIVFENGYIKKDHTFEEIRARASSFCGV